MTNLNIDRLTLKLSGISQQEGQHLARLVTNKLATSAIARRLGRSMRPNNLKPIRKPQTQNMTNLTIDFL